jgi:Fe2+ transport system protein FeoA
VPGIKIEIKEIEPFDGPITLQIDGERRIVGHKVATIVLMTPCSELDGKS